MLLFSAVGCWSAYAPVLFQELGVGLAVIGLLASVPAAVSIVGAPAWGLVADRLGDVRPPLLVAGLWAAAAAALLALQPPMPWIALVVAILAAGSSGLTPLVDARTVERLGRAGPVRGGACLRVARVHPHDARRRGARPGDRHAGDARRVRPHARAHGHRRRGRPRPRIAGGAGRGRRADPGARAPARSGDGPVLRRLGRRVGRRDRRSWRSSACGSSSSAATPASSASGGRPTRCWRSRRCSRTDASPAGCASVAARGGAVDLRRPGGPVRGHRERARPRGRRGARRHRLRAVPGGDDDVHRAPGARRAPGDGPGAVHEHGVSRSARSSARSSPVWSPARGGSLRCSRRPPSHPRSGR